MSAKLFVGNLSPDTTSDELSGLLSEVGGVEWCHLIIHRETGISRGFAFVQMDSREMADAARERFNGQDMHGRGLRIEEAKPRNERPVEDGYDGTLMF